jgi:hypothetical protein
MTTVPEIPANDHATLDAFGLSVAQVLEFKSPPIGALPPESSCLMQNDVMFSNGADPSIATAAGRLELIRVETRGALLTLADVWGEHIELPTGKVIERVGARLYALRTLDLHGAAAYMLLSQLPAGISDEKFFPAEGTVVLFEHPVSGERSLRACGRDRNSGACLGWIFNAWEV